MLTHQLKYEGRDQKKILIQKARESGAEIVNRVMVFDLLRDEERIIGAVGIDTREDSFVLFESKAVILDTGTPP